MPQPEDRERIEQLEKVLASLRAERETPTPEESAEIAPFVEALRSNDNWRWETPRVRTAVSDAGAELAVQPDESVLAGGANPAADRYTFTLETESTGLRSIMLEALADPTLPQGESGEPPTAMPSCAASPRKSSREPIPPAVVNWSSPGPGRTSSSRTVTSG